MGAANWIVRHSKVVIAVWVVALILSAPLAMNLDKVLRYEETQFLPTNVESVKANDVLKEEFGISALGGNRTILLITGINAGSPEAKQAYLRLKDEVVGKYVDNMTSYYDVMDELNDTSYRIALNITKEVANLSKVLWDSAKAMNESFVKVLGMLNATAKGVKLVNESLTQVATAYIKARSNLSKTYNELMKLRDVLNSTDAAYVAMVKNLTQARTMLERLEQNLATLNKAVYGMKGAYAKTFFDVTRTYYYLTTETKAYETGKLTPRDVYVVENATGNSRVGSVDPKLMYVVFNATYPLVKVMGPQAVSDQLLANLTAKIIEEATEGKGDTAQMLARVYGAVFLHVITSVDQVKGSKAAIIYAYNTLNQDEVYAMIDGLAEEALKALPSVLMQATQSTPQGNSQELAALLTTAINLGPNPAEDKLINATVSTALNIMKKEGSPLASMPNAEALLRELLVRGVTKDMIRNLLVEALKQHAGKSMPQGLLGAVVDTVLKDDPQATGTLIRNATLLEYTVVSVSTELMTSNQSNAREKEPHISPAIIKRIYESGGSATVLDSIAKELVRNVTLSEAVKAINASSLPPNVNVTDLIKAVVNAALRDPDAILNGSNLKGTVINVLFSTAGNNASKYLPSGVNMKEVISEVYDAVANNSSVKSIAEDLFLKGVKEHVSNLVTNLTSKGVPKDLAERLKDASLRIAEAVARNYPCRKTLLESVVKEELQSIINDFMKSNEKARYVAKNLSIDELVSIAFTHRDSPEAITYVDVKPVATEISEEILKRAKTYVSMLKSDDNSTLAIITYVKGGNDEEKYENALKVRDLAREAFGKHFSSVKVYVTGEVVSKEELKHYGERDVSTVNKVSIIGALIVLFIVIGSVAATLMPFVSIGTAIIAASAIVYVIASGVMSITSWARVLMTTTALGLGIDYSTYYLYRFKEYLTEGMGRREAAAEALRRAFDAVMASALTDIVAFASFMIAWDFPFLRVMGVVIPIAVVAVLAASLTLVPALAAEFGSSKKFWWPRIPRPRKEAGVDVSKVVSKVTKYAVIVVIIAALLGVPATQAFVSFSGSHDIKLYLPQGSQEASALTLMKEKFGASLTTPTYVVLELKEPFSNSTLPLIEELSERLASLEGVKAVYSPTMPFGEKLSNLTMSEVTMFNGTKYVSSDNRTVMFTITMKYLAESSEARNLVRKVRDVVKDFVSRHSNIISKAYVGGLAAMEVDLDDMINEDFWHKILPIAIVLMFLSLLPTLKGLPAAAATMTTIYLGTVWSIWLSTNLFHYVFNKPMLWFLPMVVLNILLGVGIDYNSFYLVRARDEYERRPPREALAVAAASADNVVMGLAAILATTYASLILTTMWAMREMGFTLALGIVLVSASAVYFVSPALMALFGKYAWWPKKIGRGGKQ